MLNYPNNLKKSERNEREPLNFLDPKKNNPDLIPKKSKKHFFVLTVFIVLMSIFVIRNVTPPAKSDNPYEYDPITLEPKGDANILQKITNFVFKRQPELEGKRDDRINILLLGMGGPGHNGPYLTDTIIIVSIKPSTGHIAMISIPRDLGVDIPDYGKQKINSANAYGEAKQVGAGGVSTVKVIEDTFDIKIPYYVRIDFQAFIEIIDNVGGVKINVDKTFTDNEFPAPNDNYRSLTFKEGVQTMDGERALQYARSRHGNNNEGSDFARAKRQQKVILSLKEKILSFQTLGNPIRITKIIKSLDTHISTNIDLSSIISLLKIGRTIDLSNIITLVFDIQDNAYLESSYTKEGAYILSPITGNFKDMTNTIKNIFEQSGDKDTTPSQDTPAPESINIVTEKDTAIVESNNQKVFEDIVEIQNGTWQGGLAARIKEKLVDQGIKIGEIGNTQTRPTAKSGVYVLSAVTNQEIIEKIQTTLNIPLVQGLPDGEIASGGTGILIILGEDFEE